MDKEEVIEELQRQVKYNHISDINELVVAVLKTGLDIDAYIDGWYDNDHEHVYIEEQEVKEIL